MSFVVDPQLVSFESIKQSLVDYVKSRSSSAAWKDFYEGSTGTVIIELMAGMMAYLQYIAAVNRRESYLAHAQSRSSMLAISETLGYPAYRGRNPVITLKVLPDTTLALPTLSLENYPLGKWGQYYLYPTTPITLTAGETTTIDVAVGTLKTSIIPIETISANVFRFFDPRVSEDLVLLMGKETADFSDITKYDDNPPSVVEWPLSRYLKDLANNMSVVLSNPMGSVDIFSLNNMVYSYGVDFNLLQLKYIELAEISFDMSEFIGSLDFFYGDPDPDPQQHVVYPFVGRSTKEEIRVNAPVYHETAIVVRGREDYPKLIQQTLSDAFGDCKSVSARDPNPAEVELTYVLYKPVIVGGVETQVLTPLTPMEVLSLQSDYIEQYRPFGVRPPYISPILNINDDDEPGAIEARQYAVPETPSGYVEDYYWVDLTVQVDYFVSRSTLLNVAQGTMESDTQAVLNAYLNILKSRFNLEKIEYDLEQFSWVKTANISVVAIRLWNGTAITNPATIAEYLDLSSNWDRFHTMGQGAVVSPYKKNLIVTATFLG